MENKNNGFGPVTTRRSTWSILMASAGVVGGWLLLTTLRTSFSHHSFIEDLGMFCGVLSAMFTGEIVRRLCLYAEEHFHVETRYMGSKTKALKACLSLPTDIAIFLIFIAVTIFWALNREQLSLYAYLTFVLIGPVGLQLLQVRPFSKVELSELNERENKHVSDGLAWSYYFGYLKLIFPDWGDVLQRAIAPDYEINGEDIQEKLTDKRLFIIIPKNCYCYDSLRDVDNRISHITTMPEIKKLRGGVQNRVYRCSLYQVNIEGEEPMYLMMEYATPLLSMYDMSRDSNAAFDEENRKEQVVQFYNKLKEILDADVECRANYKIILADNLSNRLADILYDTVHPPAHEVGVQN